MSLTIKEKIDENSKQITVYPIGEIDIYTSDELKSKLIEIISSKDGDLVLECDELEFIDSTGLGALISVLKVTQEKDKEIILRNVKPNIKKLFFLTKLDQVFKIEE